MIPRGLAHVVATHDTDAVFARAWVSTSPPRGGSLNDASQIPLIDREKFLEAAKINIWILATVFTLATSTLYTAFTVATQRTGISPGHYMKILADTFGTIVRHQFYPTCDFLQIFHSKVQLAIQGLPFEFPGAPTCAEIRSEYECASLAVPRWGPLFDFHTGHHDHSGAE